MAGILGDFFLVSFVPQTEAQQILKNFGENSEQNSEQKLGQIFKNFGELSFCNFS